MFPLRDDNPTVHTSVATFTIIGLNVAAWFFLQDMGNNPGLAKSLCKFGLIPGEFLAKVSPGTQVPLGSGLVCLTDAQSHWYTPFSSMFMHGGWLHIIFNMWFLYIFGDNVEDAMGPVRFMIFYILCGLAAVGAQLLANPASTLPMVGASGAIGGVMGGYALLYPKAPVHMLIFLGFFVTRIIVPAYFMLGYWFIIQLISAVPTIGQTTGGVAFWAHVGGFAAGIILVNFFCSSNRLKQCRDKRGAVSRFIRRLSE